MEALIGMLERHLDVFQALLSNLQDEEFLFRESENKWNLLEIVCHLYDEERDDFRARLHSVLTDPSIPFNPIDPVGWVIERRYAEKDFSVMLNNFVKERKDSINWLKSFEQPKWENTYHHPTIGPMSGRFILANWVAHDLLHIRQITRVRYHYLHVLTNTSLRYAGDW